MSEADIAAQKAHLASMQHNAEKAALLAAAKDGNLRGIQTSLGNEPGLLEEPLNDELDTALLVLARFAPSARELTQCLEFLICESKCKLTAMNKRSETFLFIAAEHSHLDFFIEIEKMVAAEKIGRRFFMELLSQGNIAGISPLMAVAKASMHRKVNPFLEKLLSYDEVKLSDVCAHKRNVLFYAVDGNDDADCSLAVKTLLTRLASAREPAGGLGVLKNVDLGRQTVLIAAAKRGHLECMRVIIGFARQLGPQLFLGLVNSADEEGTVCYHCCNNSAPPDDDDEPPSGYYECLTLLIENGASITHLPSPDQRSPLHIAVSKNHKECVEILLRHGADGNERIGSGTVADVARKAGADSIAELVDEHNQRLKDDLSYALRIFSTKGDLEAVKSTWQTICEKHTDVDEQEQVVDDKEDEMTAFLLACKFGHADVAEFLMSERRCNPKVVGEAWRSASLFACMYGHANVLKKLIGTEAYHVSGTAIFNEIPLHTACGALSNKMTTSNGFWDECIQTILANEETYMAVHPDDEEDVDVDHKDSETESTVHDAIPFLMRTGPKGKQQCTALQWYLRSAGDFASESIVIQLVENDLPCTESGGSRDHGHSWAALIDPHNGLTESKCLELVKAMIQADLKPRDQDTGRLAADGHAFPCRNIVRELALSLDEQNRSSLHHTWPLVKEFVEKQTFFCGRYDLEAGPPLHISDTAVVIAAQDHDVEQFYDYAFEKHCSPAPASSSDAVLNEPAFHDALKWLSDMGLYSKFAENEVGGENEAAHQHFKKASGQLSLAHRRRSSTGGRASLKLPPPGVTKERFIKYCTDNVGETVRVAIKFLHFEDQWLKEISCRGCEIDSKTHKLSQRADFRLDGRFVLGILPHGLSDTKIKEEASKTSFVAGYEHKKNKEGEFECREIKKTLGFGGLGSGGFPYAIIMPAAERSLAQIYREENPSPEYIRQILKDVAQALLHCHSHGIVHGDVKMGNIVRVGKRMKLIDLDSAMVLGDSAAAVSEEGEEGEHAASAAPTRTQTAAAKAVASASECAGLKFSSANLPPEMFYELRNRVEEERQYKEYWRRLGYPVDTVATNTHLNSGVSTSVADEEKRYHWSKIQPAINFDVRNNISFERVFVVKTYDLAGGTENLPYTPLPASPSLDIWALGCMTFNLVVGKPLLASNLDEDLITTSRMQEHLRAATWSDSACGHNSILRILIDKPLEADTIAFLATLLQPDPQIRSETTMKEVLELEFLDREPQNTNVAEESQAWLRECREEEKRRQDMKTSITQKTKELKSLMPTPLEGWSAGPKVLSSILDREVVR